MKKILKRTISLLLCETFLISSLAGCGSGNGTQTSSDTSEHAEAGRHEPLTITNFNNLLSLDFIEDFHEIYPEVELELISYAGTNGSGYAKHSLEHGDIPDIYISTQNFSKDAQEKYLLDLSNYDFINNYSNTLLDAQDINGGIYLLPSGYTLTGIYYNKTIMEENGWEVPQSFHELVALSEEIEAAGYRTMASNMTLDGAVDSYFFNLGNTVYFSTPEGTEWKTEFPLGEAAAAGNDGLKESVEYFNKWIEQGFISSEHVKTDEFLAGDCVFYICLGLNQYENTTEDGKTYEFGTIPWLSENGSNNMLTRNISEYIGINKSLADAGNEQKLEDALKFLNYVSTPEGQQSLMSGDKLYMASLNASTLPENSPYQEIVELVNEGRTVPLVYVGWEKLLIPIAQEFRQLIAGEIDVDEVIEAFDSINEDILNGSSDDVYAVSAETLTLEQTAELVAIAEGKAVDADCAMISLNQYHGDGNFNNRGLAWYFYEGSINTDIINIIRPWAATISTLEMTGAEIKAMQDAGFDLNDNGNPYEYLLFTKGGMELEDETIYTLAISTGELTEDMLSKATETEASPLSAIENYLKELETVRSDAINWE